MTLPTRPTRAIIQLRAIHSNLQFIRSTVGADVRVMPVVKANAYGHGLREVTAYLSDKGFTLFGVAFPEEGVHLREGGVRGDIHVFTLANESQATLCVRHRLDPTVCDEASLRYVQKASERAGRTTDVHVKIETGMNRIGVQAGSLRLFLRRLARAKRIRVRGFFTHFATADDKHSPFVKLQRDRFLRAMDIVREEKVEYELIHAANSGAILRHPDCHFDMVRAGVLMYGYSPSGKNDPKARVRPAMELRTRIAQVKRIKAGESVSYGRLFLASAPRTIATIPIGYADGYYRGLTGKASVLVQGRRRPIVGRICMDQCMVDVSGLDVGVGDEVVLIGSQGKLSISAWDLALQAGTIPYEVTCSVSSRVPREYKR